MNCPWINKDYLSIYLLQARFCETFLLWRLNVVLATAGLNSCVMRQLGQNDLKIAGNCALLRQQIFISLNPFDAHQLVYCPCNKEVLIRGFTILIVACPRPARFTQLIPYRRIYLNAKLSKQKQNHTTRTRVCFCLLFVFVSLPYVFLPFFLFFFFLYLFFLNLFDQWFVNSKYIPTFVTFMF